MSLSFFAYNFMHTFLGSVKKRRASNPPSRPIPLLLTPPNGVLKSRNNQQFTQNQPRTNNAQSISRTDDFAIIIQFIYRFSILTHHQSRKAACQPSALQLCIRLRIHHNFRLAYGEKNLCRTKFCAHCTSATSPPTPLHSQTQQ